MEDQLKKNNKIIDEKKQIERENREKRAENRTYKKELDACEKTIQVVSLMLISKTKKTGIKGYNKIMEHIDEVSKEA